MIGLSAQQDDRRWLRGGAFQRTGRRTMPRLGGLLVLLSLTACQSAPRHGVAPRDQAMLDRLHAAREAARDLPQARETLMHLEADHVQQRLAQLRGEAPATAKQIKVARATLQATVHTLEAAPDWTPAPIYPIVRRTGGVEIDGRLDESAWKLARRVELRYGLSPTLPVAAPPYATARLLWDDEFLYAAFDVPDDVVLAPDMERDDPVYQFDCVELFLMPQLRFGSYWEINVSPGGAVMDHYCTKYHERFFSYCRLDLDVQALRHAAQVRDDGYSVEIALPLKELPGLTVPPEPGQRLWLVMAHADRDEADGPLSFFAHGQVLHSFHNIWTMPQAVFVER